MQVAGIDPRDVTWEDDTPTYRVYVWRRPAPPAGLAPEDMGYHCHEYRLTEARDVHEVLRWAHARTAADETCTVYLESSRRGPEGGGPGLFRLAGSDPTRSGADTTPMRR